MKRKIALLLAGVLAVSALTACGGGSSSSSDAGAAADTTAAAADAGAAADTTAAAADAGSAEGGKNLVCYWWGNQVRNERTAAALELYEQNNPGVSIDPQFADWGGYWDKLATLAAGNSMPDVLQMDYMYVDQYAKSGLLVDLTPYIENGTLDCSQISENTMASGTIDGGVYAICAGINSPALIYDKTLTDSIGLTIKDNMTMDEFFEYSREINEKTGVKTDISYGTVNSYSEYFMRSFDIVPFGDKKMNGTAEDWIPFFAQYVTGLDEGWLIDPSIFAEISIGAIEQMPMVYGSSPETRSWCALANSNQLAAAINAAPEGMELGITTWPAYDPVKSDYLKSSQFFSIGAGSANEEEAVKVLNFLINDIDANKILLGERGVPAPANVAEAIAPLLSETDQEVTAFINDVVTPNCSPINPPQPDGASEVYDLLNRVVEEVCYRQRTAEDAAAYFFEEANKIMATK